MNTANWDEKDHAFFQNIYWMTSHDFLSMTEKALKQPEPLWQLQNAYLQSLSQLLQQQLQDPQLDLWHQHDHLIQTHWQQMFEHLKMPERTCFLVQQYVHAFSSNHFLLTNPDLFLETLQKQGQNLLKGCEHFIHDLKQGRLRRTDETAFQIGKNIATTPGKVIFRNHLIELIQYTPQTKQVHQIPLLIIPPWIKKYYILDLSPHNSLVRWLVQRGITVFMISWINPNQSHAEMGLEAYLHDGPLAAIQVIQTQFPSIPINTLGFCIGGTLLALLLAYEKACQNINIQSATFLATLIDFQEPGDLRAFVDENQMAHLEKYMQEKGYLDGELMSHAFNALRPRDLIWYFVVQHYLRGHIPMPFDILFWNDDSTNMPAKMHTEYLRWMYLENRLTKPNAITLLDKSLDISAIDIPTFFVGTQKDHITPWKSVYQGFQLVQGQKQFLLGDSGHVAGIIHSPTVQKRKKYGYTVSKQKFYPETADAWLQQTSYMQGSWWSYWIVWLRKHSGKKIPAPSFAELHHPGIDEAPGEYINH